MASKDRFNGFLTKRGTDWLYDAEEIEQDEGVRQIRYGIRQRAARALRDLVLLERQLPDGDDRRLIFKAFLDPDIWDDDDVYREDGEPDQNMVMRDLFTFLLRSQSSEYGTYPNEIEQWIEHAVKQAENPGYVDADVTKLTDQDVADWETMFKDDPDGFIEGVSQQHPKPGFPLLVLFQSGRISQEDYFEYSAEVVFGDNPDESD